MGVSFWLIRFWSINTLCSLFIRSTRYLIDPSGLWSFFQEVLLLSNCCVDFCCDQKLIIEFLVFSMNSGRALDLHNNINFKTSTHKEQYEVSSELILSLDGISSCCLHWIALVSLLCPVFFSLIGTPGALHLLSRHDSSMKDNTSSLLSSLFRSTV